MGWYISLFCISFAPLRDEMNANDDIIPIQKITVNAYVIPTDFPESDGTLEWDSTTLVAVHISAGGVMGFGYSYAPAAAAVLIKSTFIDLLTGTNALAISRATETMRRRIRNSGQCGIGAMAVSAVDNALWDLKARLLNLPLVTLLGQVREALPIYGSGGFTSYSDSQLREQFRAWTKQGITRVKMKIGREPQCDLQRVAVAREAIGLDVELFVDANGAYDRKQALYYTQCFANDCDVRWMEQPLDSEDVDGMAWLRQIAPARLNIADGEYGYDLPYFKRRLEVGAVDVMQADATRCFGISGFMAVAKLCEAFRIPLSSHCAPSLHLHPGCAALPLRHAEYFHDHVRIERMLFDGVPKVRNGMLYPDLSRPGMGLELKEKDAEKFRV
jgi:L-alanine-DL-glutamate epimerase-like enolase superfamily enzyme